MNTKDKRRKEDQSWFWTKRWQQVEKEAEEDIEARRVFEFLNADAAIVSLHKAAVKERKTSQRRPL
jgi:hypothetical protein